MIKLLHVVYGGTGGAARIVVDIAKNHDRTRFEPAVLLVGYEVDPIYAAELKSCGVPCYSLLKRGQWDWGFLRTFRQTILKNRPDAVFLHTPVAYFWGRTAVLGLGIKCVVSVEHLATATNYGLRGRLVNLLQSHLLSDKVICVSSDVKEMVKKALWLPDGKINVIENGIPVDRQPLADPEGLFNEQPVRIKMVSRLDRQKDPATLIKAVKLLKEQGFRTRLDFAGDGILRKEMELLTIELKLSDNVSFLGTRTDIPELLLNTDIFVLSTHAEGLSIALLEAMAAGLPCVATAVPGNLDVIEDQVSGLLAKENDPESLCARMAFLIKNPGAARRMAAAARERVSVKYNITRTVREYEKVCEESLTGRLKYRDPDFYLNKT